MQARALSRRKVGRSGQIDATLHSIDAALLHLRRVFVADRGHFGAAARDVLAAYPAGMLKYVTVFDADGWLSYSSGPAQPRTYVGDRPHFRVHVEGPQDQVHVSEPLIGRLSGEPVVQVTRAIRDGQRFVGLIGIALQPASLSAKLAALQIEPTDMLAVVRTEGDFVARSHGLYEAVKTKVAPDRPFLTAQPGARGLFRSPSTVDKVPLVFAWRRLADWPLSVVAAVDEQRELGLLGQQQARERRHTAMAAALLLAFASGTAAFVVRMGQKYRQRGSRTMPRRASA